MFKHASGGAKADLLFDTATRVQLVDGLIANEEVKFATVAEDFEGTVPHLFEESPGYWSPKLPDGYLKTLATATLVDAFAAHHSDKRVCLVFGADNLQYMPSWNHLDRVGATHHMQVLSLHVQRCLLMLIFSCSREDKSSLLTIHRSCSISFNGWCLTLPLSCVDQTVS